MERENKTRLHVVYDKWGNEVKQSNERAAAKPKHGKLKMWSMKVNRYLQDFKAAHPWRTRAMKWVAALSTVSGITMFLNSSSSNGSVIAGAVDTLHIDSSIAAMAMVVGENEDKPKSKGGVKEWLNPEGKYVLMAVQMQSKAEFGVPAYITLAQGIIESGGGNTKLARNGYNYFGHKQYDKSNAYKGTKGTTFKGMDDDHDKDGNAVLSAFQEYETPWWGFYHHARIIKERYAHRRTGDDVNAWVECLCPNANGMEGYDYAGACGGKDPKGKYGYKEKVKVRMNGKDKVIAGYEHTIMSLIDKHKLERYNSNTIVVRK